MSVLTFVFNALDFRVTGCIQQAVRRPRKHAFSEGHGYAVLCTFLIFSFNYIRVALYDSYGLKWLSRPYIYDTPWPPKVGNKKK